MSRFLRRAHRLRVLITDECASDIANYRFSDYDQLEKDYRAGIFNTAFQLGSQFIT
jgi:hypothetical protein